MTDSQIDSPNGYLLDIDSWDRAKQYRFFLDFEVPFFGVTTQMAVTQTRRWCKSHNKPFALACWYICLQAINAIDPFRYRLRELDDGTTGVWAHDRVTVSATSANDDGTFRFCYFPDADNFEQFCETALPLISGPEPEGIGHEDDNDGVVYGSVLPWVHFTGLSHARRRRQGESVPRIAIGKFEVRDSEAMMPVNVEVHHALMDGAHVAEFFAALARDFADPERALGF